MYHLGPEKDRVFFTELSADLAPIAASEPPIRLVPLDQAQGIVCTGLFDDLTETPEDYRATLLYAKTNGLKLLCANPDIIVDFGDKRLYCAGAIAQAYDQMGGESLYFGKPHPPIYDMARRRYAALPGAVGDPRILAMGDGVGTDVQGAVCSAVRARGAWVGASGRVVCASVRHSNRPSPRRADGVHAQGQQRRRLRHQRRLPV